MNFEADSKLISDLDELGPSAGSGIYVPAMVDGELQSVDICTLTDESLKAWLESLNEEGLRKMCRIMLGRST